MRPGPWCCRRVGRAHGTGMSEYSLPSCCPGTAFWAPFPPDHCRWCRSPTTGGRRVGVELIEVALEPGLSRGVRPFAIEVGTGQAGIALDCGEDSGGQQHRHRQNPQGHDHRKPALTAGRHRERGGVRRRSGDGRSLAWSVSVRGGARGDVVGRRGEPERDQVGDRVAQRRQNGLLSFSEVGPTSRLMSTSTVLSASVWTRWRRLRGLGHGGRRPRGLVGAVGDDVVRIAGAVGARRPVGEVLEHRDVCAPCFC